MWLLFVDNSSGGGGMIAVYVRLSLLRHFTFYVLLTSVNNNNYSSAHILVPIGDAKSVNLSLYFLYGNSRGRRCALGQPEASALGGNTPSP